MRSEHAHVKLYEGVKVYPSFSASLSITVVGQGTEIEHKVLEVGSTQLSWGEEFALFHPLSLLVNAHMSSDRRADEIRAVSVVSGSKVNFIKSKAPLTAISRKENKALFITGISIEAIVWPPYRLSPPHPHWLQIRDGRRELIKLG